MSKSANMMPNGGQRRSQPPMTFDLSLSESAGSGSRDRLDYAAFVISYTLLKNISASLKSGKMQTAPSADNRVARLPVPMPMNGMPTLRHARASQTPSPTYRVQANDSPYRSAALCLESRIMDSLSRASSADAAGWSSKHIPALAILRRAESRQPPVASETRCELPCASRDNTLSAPATGAKGDCDEAAASNL